MVWSRWKIFLSRHGLSHDEYLDVCEPIQRILLLGAFAEQVRSGSFTPGFKSGSPALLADTVRDHVEQLAASFIDAEQPDP